MGAVSGAFSAGEGVLPEDHADPIGDEGGVHCGARGSGDLLYAVLDHDGSADVHGHDGVLPALVAAALGVVPE